MRSNIRDIYEGRTARSLAYVFRQLADIGVRQAETRPVPRPLTARQRRRIRANLRKALWDSVLECQKRS